MKRAFFFSSLCFLLATIFCLACLAGCVGSAGKGGQFVDSQDVYVHTVEWPGETMPMIAQWYTGNKDNWKVLSKTNPGIAGERPAVGDQILIPLELMKNNKNMPEEFLSTFSPQKPAGQRKSSSKTKQAPEKKDAFQPYGPK